MDLTPLSLSSNVSGSMNFSISSLDCFDDICFAISGALLLK